MFARYSVVIVLVAALLATSVVFAQDAPPERKYVEPLEADIAIDSVLFLRLRTPAAGFRVVEREKIINDRLIQILSYHNPAPVTISAIRGKPTIWVDGVKLVTVYPRDVEANNAKSMMGLAKIWAGNVATGLVKVWPGCRFGSDAKGSEVIIAGPAPDEPATPEAPADFRGK
ncbi:MAG TPA: hypothetical protein QGH10_09270 [Armatimonadota bacterium]|nr:hypothetical protein [Armatimonadota bacterium]